MRITATHSTVGSKRPPIAIGHNIISFVIAFYVLYTLKVIKLSVINAVKFFWKVRRIFSAIKAICFLLYLKRIIATEFRGTLIVQTSAESVFITLPFWSITSAPFVLLKSIVQTLS